VAPNTVIRVLKKQGIHPRRAVRKLFLTEAHANLRVEFAISFGIHEEDWWENVIFSDEKSFG
jgi:Transposase